jgi:hypothetical protein
MSRRPATLSPEQLLDAARAAVATAVEERTVALTEAEARGTNGGGIVPTFPTLSGAVMTPPPSY